MLERTSPIRSKNSLTAKVKVLSFAICMLTGGYAHASGAGGMSSSSNSLFHPALLSQVGDHAMPAMDLGVWHQITLNALMPGFMHDLGMAVTLDTGLLANQEFLLAPEFAQDWYGMLRNTALTIDFAASSRVPELTFAEGDNRRLLTSQAGMSFDRSVLATGLSTAVGESSAIDVAAVFAHQQYASWGLGALSRQQISTAIGEDASGTGLRLGFSSELAPGVQFGAAYQSRIDMDAFQNYRGVYSEPGDFDIPASANFGIVVQASPTSSLSFDVQRVLYSEVSAVTSQALPDRVLSLLGDSSSPVFAWDDLTVYRLGYQWNATQDLSWQFEYSTSQQPLPDSALLTRALQPDLADRNMRFGFSKRTGRFGRLNVAATYAPADYILGTTPLLGRDGVATRDYEFDVVWIWEF